MSDGPMCERVEESPLLGIREAPGDLRARSVPVEAAEDILSPCRALDPLSRGEIRARPGEVEPVAAFRDGAEALKVNRPQCGCEVEVLPPVGAEAHICVGGIL